jgi:hypothetical protein
MSMPTLPRELLSFRKSLELELVKRELFITDARVFFERGPFWTLSLCCQDTNPDTLSFLARFARQLQPLNLRRPPSRRLRRPRRRSRKRRNRRLLPTAPPFRPLEIRPQVDHRPDFPGSAESRGQWARGFFGGSVC